MAAVKVKLLTGMTGARAWNPGDEYPCSAAEAARLIKAGYAEPIGKKVETAVKAPAPVTRAAAEPAEQAQD